MADPRASAYDPYGQPRVSPTQAALAVSGTVDNPLRFAGGYSDSTQGGDYTLGPRSYSPATGRFNAVDPLTPPAGSAAASAYAYAGDQPTRAVDPSGLCWSFIQRACDAVGHWVEKEIYKGEHADTNGDGKFSAGEVFGAESGCNNTTQLTPQQVQAVCNGGKMIADIAAGVTGFQDFVDCLNGDAGGCGNLAVDAVTIILTEGVFAAIKFLARGLKAARAAKRVEEGLKAADEAANAARAGHPGDIPKPDKPNPTAPKPDQPAPGKPPAADHPRPVGSGNGGRRGIPATRELNQQIVDANPELRHLGGAKNSVTGDKLPETPLWAGPGTGRIVC